MGLYVEFDVGDYGLVSETEALVADMVPIFINMKWAPACEAFVKTFKEEAIKLVPVDTGYLRSTIDAGTDGYRCWAEVSAEYAEYVEYGTWFMGAQPYFEPALKKAMQAFFKVVEDIKDEKKAELAKNVSSQLEDIMGSIVDFFLIALIMVVIIFITAIIDEIFEDIFGRPWDGDLPEVLIT